MIDKIDGLEEIIQPPFNDNSEITRGGLWKNEDIFVYYEQGRKIFRPLNRQIAQDTFRQYVTEKDTIIVEIGAGIGEMSKLLPHELKSKLVHTEKTEEFARISQKNNPDSQIVNADAYILPFADESVDIVTGFSMYDTLHEAEKATEEIKRVLKKGGKFIHFLDLEHNDDALFNDFKKEGKVVFPSPMRDMPVVNPDQDMGEDSFCSAPRKEIEDALDKVNDKELKALIERYLKNPWEEYVKMRDITGFEKLNKVIFALNKLKVLFPAINPTGHFQQKMQRVFSEAGFDILQNNTPSKQEFVSREDERVNDMPQEYNYVRNKIGRILKSPQRKFVPEGMVKIESIMHVIVAQKQ